MMQTKTLVMTVTAGAIALGLAGMALSHDQGRGGGWAMHKMAMGGFGRLAQLFEEYDSNSDGSLTQAEIDAGRAAQLGSFDTDGNGTLNLSEYEALWMDAMRERMVDRFQANDADGDGEVTVEEFGARFARLVQMMDRTGDEALSIDDMRRGGPRRPAE